MPGTRSYTSGSFFFNLEGVKCGFIKSVEGGNVSAEVITEQVGPEYFVKKHIGAPRYEDFKLQIDLSMARNIYDWISASWKANYQRKDGSIHAADYNFNVKSEREFFTRPWTGHQRSLPICL